jgi:catechol 2,3-dioxygenase-like lactoylglutathione lyase family enzyme
MKVKRIVANIATLDPGMAQRFYQDVLGLDLLMDHGWIATYGSSETMSVQVSFAREGGLPARRCRTCQSRSTISTRRCIA